MKTRKLFAVSLPTEMATKSSVASLSGIVASSTAVVSSATRPPSGGKNTAVKKWSSMPTKGKGPRLAIMASLASPASMRSMLLLAASR